MSDSQRWQVPVLEDDAAELARLAKLLGHTRATLAVKVLEAALDDRSNIVKWIASRIYVGLTRSRDAMKGKRRRPAEEQGTVRIELQVPYDIANQIHRMAWGMSITYVRMASLLLTAGLDENSGIIEIVSRLIVQPIQNAKVAGRTRKRASKQSKRA